MVDHATADVADHYAVLLTTDPPGDVLLVHDVVTNPSPVKDLTVKIRTLVEDLSKATTEIRMAPDEDSALRIFDYTID
jgi:hypothetical protein